MKAFVLAWVAVGLAVCGVVRSQSITLGNSPNGSQIVAQAHDADFSGHAAPRTVTVVPTGVPSTASPRAVDGGSSAANVVTLSNSGLSATLDFNRAASNGSLVDDYGRLTFTPNYNLRYRISGAGSVSGRIVNSHFGASLVHYPRPDQFDGIFSESQANTEGQAGNDFSIGNTPNAIGTLFAGQIYQVIYDFGADINNAFNDVGASGSGHFSLKLSLRGDLNGDGSVDFNDLLKLAQNYGRGGGYDAGDINGDGKVGFEDLLLLAQQYGASAPVAPAVTATPEPSVLALLPTACLMRRRRRVLPLPRLAAAASRGGRGRSF